MNLYFIAITPDEKLSEEIRTVQKDFAERFSSEKAYRNFPHITVIPPFRSYESEEKLLEKFRKINISTPPFRISINGFGCFPNAKKPVIFLQPETSSDLENLFREIRSSSFPQLKNSFHPHLTVAYRDLSPDNFRKAWEEYKDKKFSAEYEVKRVGLYKHFGGKWNLIAEKMLA